jgi:hypothetical protein
LPRASVSVGYIDSNAARTKLPSSPQCGLAFLANKMGITPRSAERYLSADPEELAAIWYHLAEYGLKLCSGYLPFNLDEMLPPPPEPTVPIQ